MPDNQRKVGKKDHNRINVNEDYELRSGSKKLSHWES